MTRESPILLTPQLEAAVEEIEQLVTDHFPAATFTLGHGEDPEGIHLIVTVDLDDLGEVVDVYLDRLVDLQVEERLPLFVVPVRPVERTFAILAREHAASSARNAL